MTQQSVSKMRSIVFSSSLGTMLEYYDFFIYVALAPTFAKLFFPTAGATVASLLEAAGFGAAFLARPIGTLIFSPMADRVGRKNIRCNVEPDGPGHSLDGLPADLFDGRDVRSMGPGQDHAARHCPVDAVAYPAFAGIKAGVSSGSWAMVTVYIAILAGLTAMIMASLPAFISECFPPQSHTTGFGLAQQLGNVLFGGFLPFISLTLVNWTGNPLAGVIYSIASLVLMPLLHMSGR